MLRLGAVRTARMHHVPGLNIGDPLGFGPAMQDGWDSSLELLWQLEQEGSDSTREPKQKEPLHFTGIQLASKTAHSGDLPAGISLTDTNVEATGTQRRLQTRRTAQKRFRMREKVCKALLLSSSRHPGYTLIWHSSAGAQVGCGNRAAADAA